MEIILTLASFVAGAIAGNRIARWKGINVGLMTFGALVAALVAIPIGLVVRRKPEKSTGSIGQAMVAVAAWVSILFVTTATLVAQESDASHRETINNILANNFPALGVEVDHVSLPWSGYGPLFMSRYNGFFTMRKRGGMQSEGKCALAAIDFRSSETSSSYVIEIDAGNMAKIAGCAF